MIPTIVATHVIAGALWTLMSLVVAMTRLASRPLLGVQTVAAFVALAAGITLWHTLHAGPFGATEHWLIVGTLLAFVALGLQLGIVIPALRVGSESHLAAGSLVLHRISAAILMLAALAMAGSMHA